MAEIVPFRAYRYNPERVELFQAVTQPYDKITPDMQEKYYAASPFNLIAVEKGKSRPDDSAADNVYTRAALALEEWIASGVLLRDAVPADVRLLSGVHRARQRRAANPQRFHRARPRRGLLRRSNFPPRANARRAESGSPGTFAPHANAHGTTFHALHRSRAPRGCAARSRRAGGETRGRSARRIRRRAQILAHHGRGDARRPSRARWPSNASSSPTAIIATRPRSPTATNAARAPRARTAMRRTNSR